MLVLILIVAFSSFTTIASGTVGVVSVFGAVRDTPVYEGLHTVIPFVTTVNKMNTKTQKVEALCAAASKDLQTISTTIVVNYHVVDSAAPMLYRTVGNGYQDIVIVPASRSRSRQLRRSTAPRSSSRSASSSAPASPTS